MQEENAQRGRQTGALVGWLCCCIRSSPLLSHVLWLFAVATAAVIFVIVVNFPTPAGKRNGCMLLVISTIPLLGTRVHTHTQCAWPCMRKAHTNTHAPVLLMVHKHTHT